MKLILLPAVVLAITAFGFQTSLKAQPLVNIETVHVGDAGNAAYATGYGSVAHDFNMGKYEVTIGQYAAFLNSVASVTADSFIIDLWNPSMAANLNAAGISRSGSGTLADPYSYTPIAPSGLTPIGATSAGNRPISDVSWFDAARFANWVNNGATNGASTETGAYALNGATSGIYLREAGASWWIPNQDEWIKAAYYKGGGTNAGYWTYAMQSDEEPSHVLGSSPNQANFFYNNSFAVTGEVDHASDQNYLTDVGAFMGSDSFYGTFDQNGNVWEWNDAVISGTTRGVRGGSWTSFFDALQVSYNEGGNVPANEFADLGFRLATVPEPSTYALLLMTGVGAFWMARRRSLGK